MAYYVRSWETDEIIRTCKTLPMARRYCRGQGHTGVSNGAWYLPVAYVANEAGGCVYNPRFSTQISSEAAGLVNAHDDCLRG